ncbi:phage tail tape measure protein [Streptomyces sp. NPDC001549]|uniref:phage tail tape measure protein n=1 Tax=Streptomyces sp. NPDC001549 TaxID=3364586 RepID=UPI003692E7AA
MPNVGYATIQIIPSVRGIGGAIRQQLEGPAGQAGSAAGDAAGGRLKDSLKAGAAAAGVLAGALLVKGITDAVGQMNAKSMLQAQLGTTDKVAAQQGKVAGKLFASGVTDSFQGAADAIKSVMQAGLAPPGATEKQLQAIATKASDVATVFGQDLGGVTNAVSQLLRTGLAPSAEQAFDLITRGFQSGADKGGDLLDTINEYGVQFKKAGLDGSAAVGLINQAIQAGARDSDVAADAIKEFSIRAVDGSKTSQDGFKALGLSADDMAAKFAAGGATANGVLDLTLDRLRDIKDPVLQAQTAVALFGTQAEDLGSALLAMDPSTAVAGLGQLDGAAKTVGDTIRSGPAHEVEVFTRNLQQGFVEVLGGTVIPAVVDLAHWLKDGLTGSLRVINDAIGSTVSWFKEWGILLSPLVVLVGALTASMIASAVAAGADAVAIGIVTAVMRTAGAVTKGFAAAQALLNAVMALNPITLIVIALVALAAGLVVAYQKSETFRAIVQGAWAGIQTAAAYAWSILKPILTAIGEAVVNLATLFITVFITPTIAAIKLLSPVVTWLWERAIKPAWDGIAAGAKWLWQNGIKPAFDSIMLQIRLLGSAAMWLWQNTIKPAWDGIGTAIQWVWQNAIKPAFDNVSKGVGYVRDAFSTGVSAIGRIWEGLKDITRKPVQFIIDTVYNNGIRKVWNQVAEFTGSKQLGVLTFASGGSVFGAGTATSDSIPALLSNGEHVWTAREVRGAGGHGAVEALRARAASSGSAFAKGGAVGLPRFADGGVVDWLSGKARQIGSALMDGIEFMTSPSKAWDVATKFIRDQIGSSLSGSQWAQALSQFPIKMLQSLKEKVVSAAENLIGGSASGSVAAAMGFARSQAGKPYQWGGAGDPSWDCSGFMSGIQKVIQGLSPGGRLWSTFSFQGDTAPAGWKRNLRSPFMIGITNDGVGHTAGTLAGMNVESRGGDGVVVGARARGYNSPLFHDRYGFAPALRKYDSGGWLQPGVTTAVNATGRPEAILTAPQWQAVSSLAKRGTDQRSYHWTVETSEKTAAEVMADMERRMQFVG